MSTSDPTGYAQATERIRASAKWLIASFAAVGALFVSGIQLSDFGKVTGKSDRLGLAIAGVTLVIVGVSVAIGAAGTIVTKTFATLGSLTTDPSRYEDPERIVMFGTDLTLLGGFASVEALRDRYQSALRSRTDTYLAALADPTDENVQASNRAEEQAEFVDQIQSQVVEIASFLRLKNAYRKVGWMILFGAALTAGGVSLFAWAANPPNAGSPIVVRERVSVAVKASQRAKLRSRVGKRCDLRSVTGVVLATTTLSYEVAIEPTNLCKAAVVVIPRSLGAVTPVRG